MQAHSEAELDSRRKTLASCLEKHEQASVGHSDRHMATKPLGDAGDVANHDEEANATGASNLHEQLVAARAHLLTQAEQILAKDEQLSTQAEKLSAKDEQLSAKDEQLLAKDEQLSAKDEQLSAKDEQLSAQADELEQLRAQLQRLEGVPPQLATQD